MRLFLAPMEGVVDFHLRQIYAAIAPIDACVTEFIRVTEHLMPRKVFVKSCPELEVQHRHIELLGASYTAHPIKVQLLGSKPEVLAANAAKAAALGAIGIDLNFGCPAKTVNRSRGGACLLDDTELIADIVQSVRQSVPDKVPVSAKIRLGYNDRSSYLRNATAIEQAGADEITVHARSKRDGYKPPAYWEYIAEIRQALNIPVIANGDIWTLADYIKCKRVTACSDFMLGRGLLANPGLAQEIRQYEAGQTITAMRWADLLPFLTAFFRETSFAYPKKYMGNRLKQWLHYLKREYSEAQALFEQVKREKDYETIERALNDAHRLMKHSA